MLHVIGCRRVQHAWVEIDPYVPQFRCRDAADGVPHYLCIGASGRQLLEVGLNRATGAIYRVTVPGLGEPQAVTGPAPDADLPRIEGIPTCDLSAWPAEPREHGEHFREERVPFEARIGPSELSLVLRPGTPVAAVYCAGRGEFGVREDGSLCLVRFRDLTAEEMEMLRTRR